MTPGDTGHTQMLILSSDINGRGRITGMAIKPRSIANAAVITGMTVKIAHIPASTTELSTSFNNNFQGNTPVTVTQNISYSIPAGQSSPIWIPFINSDFVYDGTSNLLIDIIATVTSGAYSVAYAQVPAYRVIDANNLVTDTGTQWQRAFEPVFRFAGGTMDVIGSNDANASVFGSLGGRQFLLRAAELGASGSINKLACRARGATTAISYPNFTVTLAHTAQNALVPTDAANIAGGTAVYNGTFTMPASLLEGDWIEIPFTTPFSYNGIDNLVVQTTTGSAAVQNCQISGPDATWFADRWKATGGGSPLDSRGNFRFWVDR
jgi:hypothetical protein